MMYGNLRTEHVCGRGHLSGDLRHQAPKLRAGAIAPAVPAAPTSRRGPRETSELPQEVASRHYRPVQCLVLYLVQQPPRLPLAALSCMVRRRASAIWPYRSFGLLLSPDSPHRACLPPRAVWNAPLDAPRPVYALRSCGGLGLYVYLCVLRWAKVGNTAGSCRWWITPADPSDLSTLYTAHRVGSH